MLCAGCLGRSILGTDCSRARKYFGHIPVHFVSTAWTEPPPLRDGDVSGVPEGFEKFLTVRTGPEAADWDFLPVSVSVSASAAVSMSAAAGPELATNPHRPPRDPPPGPLPPPPARPVQPNPPRR